MINKFLFILFLCFTFLIIYFFIKKRDKNNTPYSYKIVNKNENFNDNEIKKVILEAIKLYKNKYDRN